MLNSSSSTSPSNSSPAAPISMSLSKETSNDSCGSDEAIDLHNQDKNKPSHYDTDLTNLTKATGIGSLPNTTQSGAKNKKLFPQKLWDLINDERYNFCLRWSDDGQLVYLNRDEFEDSYLKSFENQFHTQKAISFVRQMNMYGFRKVDDCYYENDNFKRDCEHLLKNMIRKHPNKNQVGYTDIAPYLYQQPAQSLNLSAVSSQHVAASSLAAIHNSQQLVNSDQNVARKRRYNYCSQDRLKQSIDFMGHNMRKDSVEFNDDSTSSFDEVCCNNPQGESIGSALESFESNLSNEILDCTNSKQKQSNQSQQQEPPPSILSHQFNSISQLNASSMQTFQSAPQDNFSILSQVGDLSQLLSLYKNNQLLHNKSAKTSRKQSATNESNCDDEVNNISQLQNQLFYYNQQELIKFLLARQQQTSNNCLINNNHAEGSNFDDLTPLMALISSINPNMHQSLSPLQSNHHNVNHDRTQILNLQEHYQNSLTAPNVGGSNLSADSQNFAQDLKVPKLSGESALVTKPSSKMNYQTSLLKKDTTASRGPLKGFGHTHTITDDTRNTNVYDLSRTSYEMGVGLNIDSDLPSMRRESKSNRSFKRSADSILDSNNNNNNINNSPSSVKKVRVDETSSPASDRLNANCVNNNAKNLVTLIASARDAKLDPEVITEASKYTERFVETLFDTAQVIARHSNGSTLSEQASQLIDNTCQSVTETDKESRNSDHNEPDRSIINLSDLTSALKLLPSKILKLLG